GRRITGGDLGRGLGGSANVAGRCIVLFRLTRRRLFVGLVFLIGAAAAGSYVLFHHPDIQLLAVQDAWDTPGNETDEEQNDRARRCLEIAREHPGPVGGLAALFMAATRAPNTAAGKEANHQLAQQIETADFGNLAVAYGRRGIWPGALQNLAPAVLARVRQSPDHPQAARLLTAVCSMTRPNRYE